MADKDLKAAYGRILAAIEKELKAFPEEGTLFALKGMAEAAKAEAGGSD